MASNSFIDNIINDSYQTTTENTNNANLKKYKLLIFSDGAHERTKQRTTFGLYLKCLNKKSNLYKFHKMKVIKKLTKDLLCFNTNTNIITYHTLFNNINNINCFNTNCKYYGIYNYENITDNYVCKNHKNDNMKQYIKYFNYEPSNIRAEGFGILYSLILIKMLYVDKINNIDELLIKINNNIINSNLDFIEYNKDPNINYDYFLIITDSEFWINVITKWSNNWFKKKITTEKKNVDIIYYINYYLHILLNNNIAIDFQFVRGHSDKNNNNKLTFFQQGNVMADKLANLAKNNNNFNIKIAN